MKIFNQNIVDQWGLIYSELEVNKNTTKDPEIWRDYFTKFKIHPKHQIPFQKWCKKIEPFIQAADSLNIVTENEHLDKYKLILLLKKGYIYEEDCYLYNE